MSVENSSLLTKKLTAMASLILGFLILSLGYWYDSFLTILIGLLALALGITLWVLKIVRRNNPNPPG
jgi:hypothetical protein